MRIIQISSADNKGGAARSAYRLHKALIDHGIESLMYVRKKTTQDESVFTYEPKKSAIKQIGFRIRRRWETGGIGYFTAGDSVYNGFAPPMAPFGLAPFLQLPETDIVNLNWVVGFWDFRILPRLKEKCKAVVWRLSDMNPFTGGCLYDNYCGRFADQCGFCPCLQSCKPDDLSRRSIMMKKRIIETLPPGFLHIIAQSNWIEKQIKASAVFRGCSVTRIPNGIDIHRLKPYNSQKARIELGLHPEHAVILFIAQSLANPRKGGMYFTEAIKYLANYSERPITVLALGKDGLPPIDNVNIVQIQDVEDNDTLSRCYSAADVYVITSLQDNLPNTVLESMACGTPVVGFDAGGVPDMVKNGETGFLTPVKDIKALAVKIIEIISNENLRSRLSGKCREYMMQEFSLETQVKSYISLYERLLGH